MTESKKGKKVKEEEPTLAEKIAAEQFLQYLDGKATKEYPKILEDM